MLALTLGLTAISLALLAVSPYYGWLLMLVVKPVIDVGWSDNYLFLGFRPLEIVGAGLPAILLLRMLVSRRDRPDRMILGAYWLLYLISVVLGAVMFMAGGDYVGTASFMFRVLNGVVAFYSFQVFFGDRASFRRLLLALLIGGLFPMAMGFYEAVTGHHWQLAQGYVDQVRITGVYHNISSLKYFAYMTVTAIALYWIYFAKRSTLVKLALLGYAVVCAVVLFRIYSKAAFATLALAGLAWMILMRKVSWPAAIAVAVLLVNAAMDNIVFRQVTTTFGHEVAVSEGKADEDKLFGARLGGWKMLIADWNRQDMLHKLFGGRGGGREARGGGHNDYIRAMIQTGVLGLFAYLVLLIRAGHAVATRALARRTPLSVIGIVVYFAWLVDTMGLTPAVYPNFQWFVWGFIGLALGGVRGLENEQSEQNLRENSTSRVGSSRNARYLKLKKKMGQPEATGSNLD